MSSGHPRATYKKKVPCGFKELNGSIEPSMFFKYFDVPNGAELEVLIWLCNPLILEALKRLYLLRWEYYNYIIALRIRKTRL